MSIDSRNDRAVVHFAVVEGFRGLQLWQITLSVGLGSCGYPFRIGESYLVYANRSLHGAELSTSICTRTRLLAEATEDLIYLRSLAKVPPGTPGRIAGQVQLYEPSSPPRQLKPVPGLDVVAKGNGLSLRAKANARGEFELTGLPLGTYEVIAQASEGYDSVARTVDVHDPYGCGTTPLFVRYDGRVTGRVVNSRGDGIHGLPLLLVPASDVEKAGKSIGSVQALSTADGTFELRLVPPGTYVLGVTLIPPQYETAAPPRVFYPGSAESRDASRLAVAAGERKRLEHFVIPDRINLVTVSGIVLDGAQRPVASATVVLGRNREGGDTIAPPFVTGADGRFAFSVVADGNYLVHVTRNVVIDGRTQGQVGMVRFTAASETPLLTVVVKPQSY